LEQRILAINGCVFLHDELSRLSSFFEVGDLASVYPSLDAARKDPVLKDLVSPLLLKAIHREASKMLSQDRPDAALLVLKDVELSRRTSTTHKLVEDAIERLKPGLNSVLTDLQVELMLRSLALKDPYISKAYLVALQDQLKLLADSGRVESAYKLLERILEIRPDPALENDLARLNLSLAALDSGDRGLARSILNGKTGRLGLFNGLRLIFAGYYFSVWFIYILFAIALASAGLLLFKSLPSLKFKSEAIGTGVRRNAVEPQSNEEPVGPGFTSPRARDYQLEEYEQNIALFGLNPGATEREIKAAYRNAVKEFHPDANPVANPDSNELASEKFIELTNAYNKIVSFTRERFDREEKQ
jgi:tetratricopeptide (TPR) repeat protein